MKLRRSGRERAQRQKSRVPRGGDVEPRMCAPVAIAEERRTEKDADEAPESSFQRGVQLLHGFLRVGYSARLMGCRMTVFRFSGVVLRGSDR